MSLRLKGGVRMANLQPQMVLALSVAADLWTEHEIDLVVTSLNDSAHSPTSLHYAGAAADIRTHNIPKNKRTFIAQELKRRLGGDFDVLHESPGKPYEHIHVEYQPRGG